MRCRLGPLLSCGPLQCGAKWTNRSTRIPSSNYITTIFYLSNTKNPPINNNNNKIKTQVQFPKSSSYNNYRSNKPRKWSCKISIEYGKLQPAVSTVWPWGFIWEFGEEGRGGDGKEGEGRIDSHLVCKCKTSNFGKLQKKNKGWVLLRVSKKNPKYLTPSRTKPTRPWGRKIPYFVGHSILCD